MTRFTAALLLAARFAHALTVSAGAIVRIVFAHTRLRARGAAPGTSSAAHFVRLHYRPMSPTGAVLLACLTTLTPGSTVLRIDLRRREMVLHLLAPELAPLVLADTRIAFEPPLLALFGTRTETHSGTRHDVDRA